MSDIILQTKGICKSFGGTQALKGIDFQLRRGEIHGLIGENGAGKSTLIKIISGSYVRDEGEIWIDGKPADIREPKDSLALGIRVISQEFNLMGDMSVAENMCAGDYPCKGGALRWVIDRKRMNEEAQRILNDLGEQIRADTPRAFSRRSRSNRCFVSWSFSAAVGSSIIRIFGSSHSALAISTVCCWATDSFFTSHSA